MKKLFFIFTIGSLILFDQGCTKKHTVQHPNMIFIVADDVGGNDLGCYGNKAIKAPNIDDLAAKGLKFTQVYLTTSSCSPSRCSILTGRYPHNTGAAELHTPLPAHLIFFPQLLRKAGYYTGVIGKWEWGLDSVTRRAYDTVLTGRIAGIGGEEQWVNALRDRPKDKPFFFWFAAHDPHRPFRAAHFDKFPDPQTQVTIPPSLVDTKEIRQDLMNYYNAIGRMDYYVGQVVKELKKEKISDNTIIVLISDNGRPFPGSKTSINDLGVKTPLIIKWPRHIKAATTSNSLISSVDIAPTLLDMAGVQSMPSIQGTSFARLLQHPDSDFRTYVFAEHNWHDYEAYERMVRTKNFFYLINLRPAFPAVGSKDLVLSPSFKALKKAHDEKRITLQNDIFTTICRRAF